METAQTEAKQQTDASTQGAEAAMQGAETGMQGAETSVKTGDPARIQLSFQLPNSEVIHCDFARNNSMEAVIESLRLKGQLFRVDAIIHRGRFLIGDSGDRRLTLEDNGVVDGDELIVKTVLSRKVEVEVFSMSESFSVIVERRDNCWQQIRQKLPVLRGKSLNVVRQQRLLYYRGEEVRTAIEGISGEGNLIYWDEEDGKEAEEGEGSHKIVDFLPPGEALKAAMYGTPRICVSEHVFACHGSGGIKCLEPEALLFDPQYIAFIEGFYCWGPFGAICKTMLWCGGYFDISSGKYFAAYKDVVLKFAKTQSLTVTDIVILFRENDLIPHWSLPRDRSIVVRRRNGSGLRVCNRRLFRADSDPLVSGRSCWTSPNEEDDFQREFSACVRESLKK